MSNDVFDLPGGPAFPVSIPGAGDNGAWGMSLRDWFAGQAITQMVFMNQALDGSWDRKAVALDCYALADAMLSVRRLPT